MTFASPYWLYAIPAALLVLWLLLHGAARARRRLLGNFAADRLLSELLRSFSPARRRFKHVLIAIALVTLFIALARPENGYTWQDTKARGIDVLFVLDSSKSMLAQDIRPNRLERAKFAILDFVDKLESDRIGLVAFAGNAFLQCPLTLDYDAFRLSLEAVDTDVIPHGGTDIARALQEAENAFKSDNNHKIIVLITDGEDLEESGIEQARQAAERGVIIYTVGVGTAEGQLIPVTTERGRVEYLRDSSGNPVMTKLDESTLNDIAEVTKGFYVPLGASGFGLGQVYEAGLSAIPEQELGTRRQKVGIERFQWPLALTIFLLMWEPLVGTRRSQLLKRNAATTKATAVSLFAAMLALLPNNARAQQDAAQLYHSGDYAAATTAFEEALAATPNDAELHYNLGNSHFAQGNYEAAIGAYTEALSALDIALQADAFYNMGNAHYLMGKSTLVDAPDGKSVLKGNADAIIQYRQAMQTGNDILRRADANRTPAALRNNQAQQQAVPQQEIQQAIQQAEQAKTATTTAKETSDTSITANERAITNWELAVNDYNNALELDPVADDASDNLQVVEPKLSERVKQNASAREAIVRHTEHEEALTLLIEELKKLLEDQQQDNQDNQDQENQDQQQNQDQQSQDNQQNDQQNQDQQQDQQQQSDQQSNSDQSQQQNQENSQQNQDNQQQPKDQQDQGDPSKENQQAPEKQEDEGEPDDASEQGEQKEKAGNEDEGKSDADKQSEEGKDANDPSKDDPQKPEDQQDGSPEQDAGQQESDKNPQDKLGAGEEGLSDEQLEELAQQLAEERAGKPEGDKQAGAATAAGEGQPAKDLPRVPGVMTREEARRLLDSLKKDDKKLPSLYIPERYNVDDEGKRKDW